MSISALSSKPHLVDNQSIAQQQDCQPESLDAQTGRMRANLYRYIQIEEHFGSQKRLFIISEIQQIAKALENPIGAEEYAELTKRLSSLKSLISDLDGSWLYQTGGREPFLDALEQLKETLFAKNPSTWKTDWIVRAAIFGVFTYGYGYRVATAATLLQFGIQKGVPLLITKVIHCVQSRFTTATDS